MGGRTKMNSHLQASPMSAMSMRQGKQPRGGVKQSCKEGQELPRFARP